MLKCEDLRHTANHLKRKNTKLKMKIMNLKLQTLV